MKHLRKLLIFFFSVIDQFFHQKRIKRFIESQKIKIRTFVDVGFFATWEDRVYRNSDYKR